MAIASHSLSDPIVLHPSVPKTTTSTGLEVGQCYDLSHDRRSALAELLGQGDSRTLLWTRFEGLGVHRHMEYTQLAQKYFRFETNAFRSTRFLPWSWRSHATRCVMGIQLRLATLKLIYG